MATFTDLYTDMVIQEVDAMLRRTEMRMEEAMSCKTDEDRRAMQLRWSIEDASERIASAIRHRPIYHERPRLFGIF